MIKSVEKVRGYNIVTLVALDIISRSLDR